MKDAEAEAILVGVAQEFAMAIVRLQLVPEVRYVARAIHRRAAVPAAVVRHDVMEHNKTAFAHQLAVEQEILFHTLVAVVPIDK